MQIRDEIRRNSTSEKVLWDYERHTFPVEMVVPPPEDCTMTY